MSQRVKTRTNKRGSATPLSKITDRTSKSWTRGAHAATLSLFKKMREKVPAYKEFLKKNKVRASNIKSHKDLEEVPAISKKNYLRIMKFPKLFWNGSLATKQVLTSTSGSSGQPVYFARSSEIDDESSLIHELFFRNSSLSLNKSTLVVVCFGMGVWIGGVITYQAFEKLGRRGYPISVITPGINQSEILRILKDLAPNYDQIVLAGYPPFLKDVIDSANEQGIMPLKGKIALLFAAEMFSEKFREYVSKKAGVENVFTDTMNIYGSADLGTMAFETPLSIMARRVAAEYPALFKDLFKGTSKTPTFCQFIPTYTNFEEKDGELFVSGDSAMPLLKYQIGDSGGVYTYDEVEKMFEKHGLSLKKEAKKYGLASFVREMPFVYVYERTDLSTTLYGLQIYPEPIREVLLSPRFQKYCTGKLTLITKFDTNQDQYLEINIESKPDRECSDVVRAELQSEIVKTLRMKNSEFRELSDFLGKRSFPKLVMWNFNDPTYFKTGVKQAWVRKDS